MQEIYLARTGKVWRHIKTEKIGTEKLELKSNEKLTDYKQVPKPKEPLKQESKRQTKKEPAYSFMPEEKEKGVF